MTTNESKILCIDLETAPSIVYAWGLFDQNISLDQIVQEGYILSWSAKWLGKPKVMFDSVQKHPLFKKDPTNDYHIAVSAHALMSEASIICAHNGDNFDIKLLNTSFIKHGLTPVPPYKTIDTLKVAKNHFRFLSNKLDFISKRLGVGQKVKHEGFPLWVKCMQGDKEAWKRMEKYNKQDVLILEKVYLKLRPFMKRHPNVALYDMNETLRCEVCGSTHLNREGYAYLSSGKYHRYSCKSCGHWGRGRQNLLSKTKSASLMVGA